jgi:hypothetical protein
LWVLGAKCFEPFWRGNLYVAEFIDARGHQLFLFTKLTKIIRSSGTPCSNNTSTAFIAEPPVAGEKRMKQCQVKNPQWQAYQAWGRVIRRIEKQYLEETEQPISRLMSISRTMMLCLFNLGVKQLWQGSLLVLEETNRCLSR